MSAANTALHPSTLCAARFLLALILLGTGFGNARAQNVLEKNNSELPYQKLGPVMDNLPAGSMLKEVRIPVFDKKLRRMALLQSRFLKVRTKRDLIAENITLRYFQDDSVLIRMEMEAADFSLATGVLRARQAITLDAEKIKGQGAGGVFHLESRAGFIRGPVSTRMAGSSRQTTDQTTPEKQPDAVENPPLPVKLSELATTFTGPEDLTSSERRLIDALLESRTKSVFANRAPTRNFMTQSRQSSGRADTDLRSFSHTVEIPESRLLAQTPGRASDALSQLPPSDNEILVTAEGGMFLNPERGHISYLRNIEVTESRFTLSCGGHLKVFFPPQTLSKAIRDSKTSSEEGKGAPGKGQSNGKGKTFSELVDPYLFVMSGGVRMTLRDPSGEKPPAIATGETAVIDRRTGDIVLQGGTPQIRQGSNSLTAGSPDLYLRIYQNGDLYAEEGRWTTVGNLTSTGIEAHAGDGKKPTRESSNSPQVVVTCDGGLYLDAREGHIVYLRNVRVRHPKFRIQSDNELKIFLEKKSAELSGPSAFSDVTHVVASGRARLVQEDPGAGRPPLTATAQHAILDVENSNIILRGGRPSLSQGENSLRAGKPDLHMRLYENGSLFAEPGPWTTTGDLARLRPQEDREQAAPALITITCEGGLYFDSIKGQVVYLDEIVVQEPRFRLRCSKSMRITLTEREDPEGNRLKGPEAFSDVDKIVALGAVMITRIPEAGAPPVIANSAAATYEAASGTLALRGGRPAIRQGKSFFEAREDGLYILFYPNGSFELSRGSWEQFFDLKDKNFEKLRQKQSD